ncbi:ABC transporter ATP-binding protein [Sporosarcina sp. PTS2304]|uniref:ABC transporter ATP-binding protein n=1 Tax=Sporosarcina sp. PTS2304 TaxID=2283194 RepID=UPI000E0DF258|nr:ABC transporter ATP-binding protein [Sporosarcina sp. PTS2304]AXH99110.1 ABC transporter ATP-binding protein [Sporosarcina sp. PTS2304]
MLKVSGLSKRFGEVQAVKDVSFHVEKGTTFAFLGTNGAGKSTVIHMIIDLLKPDTGEIVFTGGNLQEVTGVVFQTHRLDEELTIEENLLIRARLYGMSKHEANERIDELLALTNISDKRDRVYGTCSGGEKRKTDMIRALLHRPAFLVLDEPTTGLDAESREEIWTFLRKLQQEQGLTIFLTTHYIEEAELVDYVLIMHDGKVEVEGTPAQLKSSYTKMLLTLHTTNQQKVTEVVQRTGFAFSTTHEKVVVEIQKSTDAIAILHEVEPFLDRFTLKETSVEDVFLEVTKQVKSKVIL